MPSGWKLTSLFGSLINYAIALTVNKILVASKQYVVKDGAFSGDDSDIHVTSHMAAVLTYSTF